MENLVYTETPKLYEKPYTTSEVIAEYAEIKTDSIMRLIRNYKDDLEEYGELGFEIRKPPVGSKGGRPTKSYHLNEEQATLLITYLDNTEPVRWFKKELVKQFFSMKKELMKREIYREVEKDTRRSLNTAVRSWEHRKTWSYKHLVDLMCKTVTGMNTKQLKAKRGVNEEVSGIDVYTSDELKEYEKLESQVIALLEINMTYEQIKNVVNSRSIEMTLSNKNRV